MTSIAGRLDRLEGHRDGAANRRLVDDLAAHHGIDARWLRAETDRILERASAGGWSVEGELAAIAAEAGCPLAAVRAEHEGILAGMGR